MSSIRLYIAFSIIIVLSCTAGFADYDLGQPALLDTTASQAPTGWFQSDVAIASSGSIYLAVWVDMRDAGRTSDLFATRISADGAVLDPKGIRLTTHASVSGKPDVCWNGESFYVVWAENTGVVGSRIVGTTVSTGGTVSPEQRLIATDGQPRFPRVTWNSGGSYYLVAWIADSATTAYYGGVYNIKLDLGPDGPPTLEPGLNTVNMSYPGSTSISGGASSISVASAPGGPNLILWTVESSSSTQSDLYGSVQCIGGGFPICVNSDVQEAPDCCWAGDHFKAVWTESTAAGKFIKGTRIGPTGSVLDPSGWTVSSVSEKQADPQIAWNGTNCLVTWTRKGSTVGELDIYGGRLDAAGNALDGSGVPICGRDGRQVESAVASIGDGFLACWQDCTQPVYPIVPRYGFQVGGVRVSADAATVGAEFPLTQSSWQHEASCSAFNGRQFLICWEAMTHTGLVLYGEIIDAFTGVPASSTPFLISTVTGANARPAAAWNGESFVVTWLSNGILRASRVSSSGAVLDPAGILIAGATAPVTIAPAIASDGNRCIIVYKISTNVYDAVLSRDGSIYFGTLIANSRSSSGGVAACWTGYSYLVAWKQPVTTTAPILPGGVDYVTVTATGVPSTVMRITDTSFPDFFRLACSGENVLMVSSGPDIRTRRFSLIGTLLDATPLTVPGTAGADCTSVAWNGSDYVLTWLTPHGTSASGWQDDMQFVKISSGNQVSLAGIVDVTDTTVSETGASMCAGPVGRTFMAFSSYEGVPYQTVRVKGLYLDSLMNVTSLNDIRSLYEGAYFSMSGPTVTATFPGDRFYVQDGRSFGIGITSDVIPSSGDQVSLTGRLKRLDGETVIEGANVQTLTSYNQTPGPLGFVGRNLGGVGPTSAFCTVDDAFGLYNIGLLVTVWGRVGDSGGGYFYVDDGSGLRDYSGSAGVKVVVGGLGLPARDSLVKVTGISSSYESGGCIHRQIRAVEWSPMSTPPPPPAGTVVPASDGLIAAWNDPANLRVSDIVQYHVWRDSVSGSPVLALSPETAHPYIGPAGSFDRSAHDTTAPRTFDCMFADSNQELVSSSVTSEGVTAGVPHMYWISCLYRRYHPDDGSYTYWETTPLPIGSGTCTPEP